MHELATTNRKQRQKKVLETGTSALYDYKGRPDKLNIALRISISTQRVIENSPLLVFQHRQIKEDKEKTFRKEKQEESTKKQEGLRQKPFIGVCPCQTNKVDGEPSFLSFQVRPLSSTSLSSWSSISLTVRTSHLRLSRLRPYSDRLLIHGENLSSGRRDGSFALYGDFCRSKGPLHL